ADNPDGLLQPGAYAQANFELPSNTNVVRIPTSALVFRERGMEVAIIDPSNKIELKPITLGRNLGTEVEVVKGLALTDRLGNSPPDSLTTGDVVRIAASPPPTNANAEHPEGAGEEAEGAGPEPKQH